MDGTKKNALDKIQICYTGLDHSIGYVPWWLGDIILLATKPLSDLYGTAACASLIFNPNNISHSFKNSTFDFLARILFIFSEQIHNKTRPARLTESEATYTYAALWPIIQNAAFATPGLVCDFKVGKTLLKSLSYEGAANYLPDGVIFLKESGVELLLLEASGALFGTSGACGSKDRHRHVIDHVKGAFGCHAMIRSILKMYPRADPTLLETVSVSFIHSSAKDDYVRLWVMGPRSGGEVLSFERKIPMDPKDMTGIRDVIDFWMVKSTVLPSQNAIVSLMKSNNENAFNMNSGSLTSFLEPTPIKPKKDTNCSGIVDLDPVSFLE
ncbi:unnamed protein product [Absidia cylindrospora]